MQAMLQKKLSVAKVFGKISVAKVIEASGEVHVMRVIGATGIKTGVSDFGEWECLTGMFRATNPETGEISDSANLFMPDVAHDMIAQAIRQGAKGVDFAFDIFAVRDDDSTVGYTYRAAPLLQAEDNPLDRIASKLDAQMALPAPAKSKSKASNHELDF
jgi:hypothetical protein